MSEQPRVLIMEDRRDWQNIIGRSLRGMNCLVDLAGTYDEAQALLTSQSYALAIIEPVLDHTSRYHHDVLRALVELHAYAPETHMILVSGSLSPAALRNVENLPKPLPLIEKQSWDRETFKSLTQRAFLKRPNHSLSEEERAQRISQEMPILPVEQDRAGMPHILLVEDRLDWQVILSRIVEESGWFWRVAIDEDHAMEFLRDQSGRFDVVLLDLRLGEGDIPVQDGPGWHLMEYLARAEPHIKIVVISSITTAEDVSSLIAKYHIAGFIEKDGFSSEQLTSLLEGLVSGPSLRIQTLGGFRIWRNDHPVDNFENPMVEEFLKILITYRGAMIIFDDLMEMLSPHFREQGDRLNLASIANAARMILEPELVQAQDSDFIIREGSAYAFRFSHRIRVDFEDLERILEDGIWQERDNAHAAAIQTYERAEKLYQGEFLPDDRVARWTVDMRNHLQNQYVRILNRLADLYARDGRFKEAINMAQLSIQHDAYHEATYRRQMRYHACAGNTEAALTVYHTLAKLLNEFFEEKPTNETEHLKESIVAGNDIACVERLKI